MLYRSHHIWASLALTGVSTQRLKVLNAMKRTSGPSGASAWTVFGKSVRPTANAPAAAGAARWKRLAGTIEESNTLTLGKRSLEAISQLVL